MRVLPHVRRHLAQYGLLVVIAAAVIPLVVVLATRTSGGGSKELEVGLAAGGETPEAVELTQTDGGAGGVTVEVTWITPEQARSKGFERARDHDLSKELLFRVKMDTHSVDLSQYDLRSISLLRDSQGREFVPQAWEDWGGSSHHREGVLVFQRPPSTGGVQLTILGLAGTPQRTFRWDRVPSREG